MVKKDLSVEFLGVHFENPFCLSSSPVGNCYDMCKKAYDAFLDAKGEAGGETRQQLLAQQEPGAFADRFASAVINSYVKKQSVLNCLDHGQRAMMIYAYIENETRNVATVQEIQKEVSKRLERNNREYFLREQQRVS